MDHRDGRREPSGEASHVRLVLLHGDHPRTGGGQRRGQRTEAGAQVEHKVAGADTGAADDLSGEPWRQEVRSLPGHGRS